MLLLRRVALCYLLAILRLLCVNDLELIKMNDPGFRTVAHLDNQCLGCFNTFIVGRLEA